MVQQRLPGTGDAFGVVGGPSFTFGPDGLTPVQGTSLSGSAFLDFLEDSELGQRANFFGRINQPLTFGGTNFANQLFGQRQNAFLGTLGRQILGGQPPSATFTDELNKNFNFARQLRRAPVSQTGRQTSPFVSAGRFLLNR